jgi:hypothetical protein
MHDYGLTSTSSVGDDLDAAKRRPAKIPKFGPIHDRHAHNRVR